MGRWKVAGLGQNGQNGQNDPPAEDFAQIAQSTHAEPEHSRHREDEFAERAAIIEFEGGVPRAWAEGFARLDADRPPAGLSPRRWHTIMDAIGDFLDRWAAKAVAAGWEATDLFGADAVEPGITWLNSGALWGTNGARVVAVERGRIIFETPDGARLSYPRRDPFRPRRLPWDLPR